MVEIVSVHRDHEGLGDSCRPGYCRWSPVHPARAKPGASPRARSGQLTSVLPGAQHLGDGQNSWVPYYRQRWSAKSLGSSTLSGLKPPSIPLLPRTASRSRRWVVGLVVVTSRSRDSTGASPSGARRDFGNRAGVADAREAAGPLDPACGAHACPDRGARALGMSPRSVRSRTVQTSSVLRIARALAISRHPLEPTPAG